MADKVRAKFYVASVEISSTKRDTEGETGTVKLQAVARGEVNKNWSKYTPSGQITLGILNPSAFAVFREHIGEEFYIDFSLAPADEQG